MKILLFLKIIREKGLAQLKKENESMIKRNAKKNDLARKKNDLIWSSQMHDMAKGYHL